MNCEALRELIPDYLTGQLTPETLQEFEAHVRECAGCQAELKQMESAWVNIGRLPQEEPTPALRGRFYSMLEREKRLASEAEREPWFNRLEGWLALWWPRRPALQLASAVLLLIAGLFLGSRINPGANRSAEIAELRNEIRQMHQMASLSLLDQDSPSERLRGVNLSTALAEPSDALLTSLTHTLKEDPNANVRLAAADALLHFRDEPGVLDAAMDCLAQEPSPMVQVALVDLLIAIQEKRALEALKNFIQVRDINPSVREFAESRIGDL